MSGFKSDFLWGELLLHINWKEAGTKGEKELVLQML